MTYVNPLSKDQATVAALLAKAMQDDPAFHQLHCLDREGRDISPAEWMVLRLSDSYARLAYDHGKRPDGRPFTVSTTWTGIDVSEGPGQSPLIFETVELVTGERKVWPNVSEAFDGHDRFVHSLLNNKPPDIWSYFYPTH